MSVNFLDPAGHPVALTRVQDNGSERPPAGVMPLLTVAATAMDTERIIAQDGSPGSGSGQSGQDLLVTSIARKKKQLPPLIPVQGRAAQPLHQQSPYGISNQGYAATRHDQTR